MRAVRHLYLALVVSSLLALDFTATTAVSGAEGWLQDIEKALTTAKEEQKDLLLNFTGSDW